jgi:hypothetical protein
MLKVARVAAVKVLALSVSSPVMSAKPRLLVVPASKPSGV